MLACWFDQMYGSCDPVAEWVQPVEVTIALWVYALCALFFIAILGSGWMTEHFG